MNLRSQDGAGSVLGVALVAATVSLVLAVAPLCLVLVARTSVSSAADASALAAADARVGLSTGFPCEVAGRLAHSNRVSLTSCNLDGFDATVTVSRSVLGFDVVATATAGPPR
jgi:secretion/DNA translocation related TadE-like protein